MANSVNADLQNIIQGLAVGSTQPQMVEDRSAFVPNVANMHAEAAKGQQTSAATEEDQAPVDANLHQKKMGLAQSFARRLDPNGTPDPYLRVASELKAVLLREKGGEAETATDGAPEREPTETPEAAETAEAPQPEGGEFARQKLNMSAYPANIQKTLNYIIQQIQRATGEEPRTVAEIFNFTKFALTATEEDLAFYTNKEQNASNHLLETQQKNSDSKGGKKLEKTEKLLTAIRADKKNAEIVRGHLSAAIQQMERLDGRRISDGFNIAPRAFEAVERQTNEGQEVDASHMELTAIYCEKVLEFINACQFYEDYAKNYSHVDFMQFIGLAFSLLGDDIRSISPSRGNAYLIGIRDGLFHVETCNQIYVGVGQIGAKIFRVTREREMISGTYVPNYLVIAFNPGGMLQLYTARGDATPNPLCELLMGSTVDYFGKMTAALMDHDVEDLVLTPHADVDKKSVRQFKNSLIMRYGRTIHDGIPKLLAETPSMGVAGDAPAQ